MNIRDRLDALSRGELAGLILIVVATLAGAGVWYLRSLPRPVQVTATRSSSTLSAPVASSASASAPAGIPAVDQPSPGATAASLVVDVAGMVHRPGVYRFPPGARVIDAVHRAGGARHGADLSLINLAAPLTDGVQIIVPKAGEAVAGAEATASGGPAAPVNINSATETELETLSGVGPVTAAAIIQYRTQHGPFRSVDDLVDVTGIGPITLQDLRPFITV